MKPGFKIFYKSLHGGIRSIILGQTFRKGSVTTSPPGCGPITVFNNLNDAVRYKAMLKVDLFEIWLVEWEPWRDKLPITSDGFRKWLWHEDAYACYDEVPRRTKLASKIKPLMPLPI